MMCRATKTWLSSMWAVLPVRLAHPSSPTLKMSGQQACLTRQLDGQLLTFRKDGDTIIDNETGSTWNIVGQAIDGELAGQQLTRIIHADHFWFSWAAFRPDTIIFQG